METKFTPHRTPARSGTNPPHHSTSTPSSSELLSPRSAVNLPVTEAASPLKARKSIKFSELTLVVSEVRTPGTKTHRVKQFYGPSRSDEQARSASPQPTAEEVLAFDFSHSADPSPLPQSTSPSPPCESKRVSFQDEENTESAAQKKMKDFGYWIRLGESGFLKPIRKSY